MRTASVPEVLAVALGGAQKALTGRIVQSVEQRCEVTKGSLANVEVLRQLDLIVPVWTMGELPRVSAEAVSTAVGLGVEIAGCHGRMCDAFRESVLWQFMTGGN